MLQGRRYEIKGLVQGVGFRPYVYRVARKHHLFGNVCNTGEGLVIEIEGPMEQIDQFDREFRTELPSLARIDHISSVEARIQHFDRFEIRESQKGSKSASISPDIAVCDACLAEMKNPHDRRYGYYLINCTDCGPRYSIIKTLPYDREMTSMDVFRMCKSCQAEYEDPSNRRYHAQPISCHQCGPVLTMMDSNLMVLAQGDEVIRRAVHYLQEGQIVALKGIGGFHLLCDATNEKAVSTLRQRKKRPKKPFAVMFGTREQLEEYLWTDHLESALLNSKEHPIVILAKRNESALASNIAPDISTIGAMVAYAPIHHLLFEWCTFPLVATSANRHDEPICRNIHELSECLGDVADVVVDFNREILNTSDDSLLQVIQNKSVVLRLGRGYTPYTLTLKEPIERKILAVGGQQKNTIALAFEDKIVLSPHIGDLHSLKGLEYFERMVETFSRFYEFTPDLIVCDKHPTYATTQWAKREGITTLFVQHHYAHVLACMAEFGLDEKVLAFSFDGTGYGEDGTLWGGEVLVADTITCERIAHLKPFPLLGGEMAIKEPKRVALSLLFQCYPLDEIKMLDLPLLHHFTPLEIEAYYKIYTAQLNTPLCSSVGRMFDAVASLCDIIHEDGYEGECGRRLEMLYDEDMITECFDYALKDGIIDFSPMIVQMVLLAQSREYRKIATGFFNTLICVMEEFAEMYPFLVVVSGGVFQNRTLLSLWIRECEKNGGRLYFQQQTPINDGGIALGQAYYAYHHIKEINEC